MASCAAIRSAGVMRSISSGVNPIGVGGDLRVGGAARALRGVKPS